MPKTIFFDVDCTLYEEKAAKIKAETATTEYISKKSGLETGEFLTMLIRQEKSQMDSVYTTII
jgi:FMN phosphatase YigB (HAD superfamily)